MLGVVTAISLPSMVMLTISSGIMKNIKWRPHLLRMFSRWQQENFFRYMRHEFALDHLPTTAVEPADPLRSVPNPAV